MCRFPPRERGWSPFIPLALVTYCVSPARAGMVPTSSRLNHQRRCFPRASGDGPRHSHPAARSCRFPPRERGWSRLPAGLPQQLAVSPARAGMVPSGKSLMAVFSGFPRASGDGPVLSSPSVFPSPFPPRERGWSLRQGQRFAFAGVSPARAGMVPGSKLDVVVRCGFPRASGDGPPYVPTGACMGSFPPRERGWSPATQIWPGQPCVSPARAGMVPKLPSSRRWQWRFPRASGDGPLLRLAAALDAAFPPRERGWSRAVRGQHARQFVSPARAGMVPCSTTRPTARRSFPRASGDGPAPEARGYSTRRFPPRERGWSRLK